MRCLRSRSCLSRGKLSGPCSGAAVSTARYGTARIRFAFPSQARRKRGMPERPGDPPPRARVLTDRERAEAARLREIA